MLLFPPIFHGLLGFFLVSIMALSLFVFPEIFAEEWTIEIQNGASDSTTEMAFLPDKVAFVKGDIIKIKNNDSVSHHIVSGLPDFPDYYGYFFDAGVIKPEMESIIPLKEVKNEAYYYLCEIHPWMTGKLFVSDTIVAQPETQNPISLNKNIISKGEAITVTGNVHSDFWGSEYQLQIYDSQNKLVNIIYGKFDDKSNYVETIDSSMFISSGNYKLNLVYALPSKVAKASFEFSNDSLLNKSDVPPWIKNVSNLWCSSEIKDAEFLNALQYMIKNEIISVDSKVKIYSEKRDIPNWVKNNTCLWSDDKISDIEFISGIEYLINTGAIRA